MKCRRSRQRRGRIFGSRKYLPCIFCGVKLSFDNSTLEHILPISEGGTNHPDNLTISCKICNNSRKSLSFEEYICNKKVYN